MLGAAGALALLAVLVPVLASADALFAAATADVADLRRPRPFQHRPVEAGLGIDPDALRVQSAVLSAAASPLSQVRERPERTVDGLAFAVMLAAVAALYALFLAVQSAGLAGNRTWPPGGCLTPSGPAAAFFRWWA